MGRIGEGRTYITITITIIILEGCCYDGMGWMVGNDKILLGSGNLGTFYFVLFYCSGSRGVLNATIDICYITGDICLSTWYM